MKGPEMTQTPTGAEREGMTALLAATGAFRKLHAATV